MIPNKERFANIIILSQHRREAASLDPQLETQLKVPALYKVFLHNDDYTPMEFVVEILETVFRKANSLATQIMLDVHKKGSGLCGIYPYEVAETKVALVIDKAKQHRHPLMCTMEEE